MEWLISFFFTLVLLAGVLWVLSHSRLPAYRPSRKRVLKLLEGVLDKQTSQQDWDLFISMPLPHDLELEQIRLRCLVLSEGDLETPPYPAGIGGYLFNREGREQLKKVCEELRELIRNEPFVRPF